MASFARQVRGTRLLAGLVMVAVAALWMAPACAATRRMALADGMVASMSEEPELYLESVPKRGEGLLAFARRLTGHRENADRIAESNGGVRRLLAGVRYRVPFELLEDASQLAVIRALFADDEAAASGWVHVVPEHGPAASLWDLARWFTGRGERFKIVRERNGLADASLEPGQRIEIPRALLRPSLLAALPWDLDQVGPHGLTYERDGDEIFAVYRLKAGEALYSSVVVRFTGRTYAEDVNALAADLTKMNHIPDVTDMAIGHAVRIPLDLLQPEFLPAGHPRRAAYERGLVDSAQYSNTVRTSRLEGITVIVDPGHGGQDPGALFGGVWEATYVYDIGLRVRRLLRETTAARIELLTRDGERYHIVDRDVLPRSRGHRVLTNPPYRIEDTTAGVHLRWYLANSLYRHALKSNGGDAEKVVFISIHADALHPSIRGAMIYVPAASLTRGRYGKSGRLYTRRAEVREQSRVAFSFKERTRSEGLSRQLAERLLVSLRRHKLAIHPEKPIRDRIIRSRRSRPFVPAVVRHNAVPAKMLVEVCNLANDEDRRLIQTRAFRQEMASAIVDGILAYYREPVPDPTRVARSRVR